MAEIEELYQAIILDHNVRPRHFGLVDAPTHASEGRNPLCGDELLVQLIVEDERIKKVGFTGQGCAISKASCSIMTETVSEKTVGEALEICQSIISILKGAGEEDSLPQDSELVALLGVKKFPARLKCATLAWHALEGALHGQETVCTEDS